MMIELLKNFEENVCQSPAICSNDPRVNALNELLMNELRQIAFYLVKTREFNYNDTKITAKVLSILSINFVMGSIGERDYIDLYGELVQSRNEIRDIYENFYKQNSTNYELLKNSLDDRLKNSILKMLKEGERYLNIKNRLITNEENRLFDLIILLVKSAAINIEKIKSYESNFNDYDFEIIRLLNLTNFPTTRPQKLKRRINEFLKTFYKIQKKLNQIQKEHYGTREDTEILLSHKIGKSILVSGDNFHELELLLKQTEGKKINVYTHGKLFLAHTYPEFKKYKNLVGHFGCNNAFEDFANFEGVILVTKNHNQKIDTIYRGLIYTSDILAPKGVMHVFNDNFAPLIENALKVDGFKKNEKERSVYIKYNKKEIDEAIEKQKGIVALIGYNFANEIKMDFSNSTIINFDYPLETDLLLYLAENAKRKNLPVSVFFSKCYPQTINIALLLKTQKVKDIFFLECKQHFVHPRIIESLKDDFNVKFLTQ